ncbi:ABC transporter substrate-binding protein [Neorhodopirellula lusitana]|uniref:ABC transporter substrate-binding protein n=1 Tax=Neorhodopirellula lusitana TaxID=445327 RepID=UPI00384CC6B9
MNRAVFFLGLVTCFVATGCSSSTSPVEGDSNLTPVSIQLNWYPEVEHGGAYQASADGTYLNAGLDVTIRAGGRETPVAPELLRGRSQFAITNADDVVLFRSQGADIVAVLAAMQNHPRCLLVREDSGVKGFEDLAGMTLQCQPGRAFLPFLRTRGYLDGVREVPYFNSIAAMVNDPKIAVQAYSVAEPLLAQQQGLEVRTLMVSDLGWNPYSSVLVTTGDMIRESPELVAKVVQATQAGWVNFLENPEQANSAILLANKHGMTAEALAFGSEQMRDLAYPDWKGSDTDPAAPVPPELQAKLGRMSPERWQTLVEQMSELELFDAGSIDPADCYTNEFLTTESSVAE